MEQEINLEQLQQMKKAFEDADEDGSGELDIDQFTEKLGPHLRENTTKEEMDQLFMKIDADCGGTVDWDEFTNFFFLQRKVDSAADKQEWRFFPQDFKSKNETTSHHRDTVEKVYYCSAVDRYVTCGRDATLRLWSPTDLAHNKTISNGTSWVTDCVYMPTARRLVCTSMDRALSFYDISRGVADLTGRVYASGAMGVPLCITSAFNERDEQEHVIFGDSNGGVVMLQCGPRELPARDLIYTDAHRDYEYIHKDHTDWVTQVTMIHELGLVSSSLDATLKITDVSRGKVCHNVTVHSKGVNAFAYSKAFSVVASGGLERDVLIWQANTNHKVGELIGHSASISHLAVDNKRSQVISLAADKVIKIWDLRNCRCLQTITDVDWPHAEDSKPSVMMYDPHRHRLVTALHSPVIWRHHCVSDDVAGHKTPLCAALYNSAFHVVVSGDDSGTICMWNVLNGHQEGHFSKAHGNAKISAMTFDTNERRLLTAAADGSIKMWNFNNGSQLREFKHSEPPMEFTSLLFVHDDNRESNEVVATGWNCKVYIWEDQDEECVKEYRTFTGHREDILCMAQHAPAMLATGDYEGRINIWNMHSGERRMSLFHRANRYETAVEQLLFLPARQIGGAPTLLSCGGDGQMRVWRVGASGQLLCTLKAAQGCIDCVNTICCDNQHQFVVVGDTSGHLRVWDVSGHIDASSEAAAAASFKQVGLWRAHQMAISSVRHVEGRDLVVVACQDTLVSLWTMTGGLVGIFGKHTWKLDDPTSYADPQGLRTEPPMGEYDYLRSIAYTDDGDDLAPEASTSSASSSGSENLEGSSLTRPASQVMALRRMRAKEAAVSAARLSDQIHANLHLHQPAHVPHDVTVLQAEHQSSAILGKGDKKQPERGRAHHHTAGQRSSLIAAARKH